MITININEDEIYMKKNYFIIALFSFFLVACNANDSKPRINQKAEDISLTKKNKYLTDIKTPLCKPKGQNINYCSKELRLKINKEAKNPANFSKNKIILKSKTRMNANNSNIYEYYFVVIDLDKRTATPLETIILTNYTDRDGIYLPDFKPQVNYSNDNNNICFSGSLIGYRNTYINVKNACFQYNDADGYVSPINTLFKEIKIEKLRKLENANNKESTIDKNEALLHFPNSEKEINEKINIIILSINNGNVICNLADCTRKSFNKYIYSKLFNTNDTGPIGATMGTYYNVNNNYGLDIYAVGYTEEGEEEVNFDYIIVDNGVQTNYIELPINSNYSINSILEINGNSAYKSDFKYKISSTGSIIKIK